MKPFSNADRVDRLTRYQNQRVHDRNRDRELGWYHGRENKPFHPYVSFRNVCDEEAFLFY